MINLLYSGCFSQLWCSQSKMKHWVDRTYFSRLTLFLFHITCCIWFLDDAQLTLPSWHLDVLYHRNHSILTVTTLVEFSTKLFSLHWYNYFKALLIVHSVAAQQPTKYSPSDLESRLWRRGLRPRRNLTKDAPEESESDDTDGTAAKNMIQRVLPRVYVQRMEILFSYFYCSCFII